MKNPVIDAYFKKEFPPIVLIVLRTFKVLRKDFEALKTQVMNCWYYCAGGH